MGAKKYIVDLNDEDRRTLESFISTGERTSRSNTRARILLKADDGLTDATISEHVGCHPQTVHNTRKDYTERGLAAIHRRKPDREYSMVSPRPTSSNSPAANPQKGTPAGRSTSLPTNSLPSTRSTSRRSLTRPSDSV